MHLFGRLDFAVASPLGESTALVFGGLRNLIDHNDVNRSLLRLQLEAQFPERCRSRDVEIGLTEALEFGRDHQAEVISSGEAASVYNRAVHAHLFKLFR